MIGTGQHEKREHMKTVTTLADAIKAGNLHAAFGMLHNLNIDQVQEVMLRAGFSSLGKRDRRAFWKDVQSQISRACALRLDGWQLVEYDKQFRRSSQTDTA